MTGGGDTSHVLYKLPRPSASYCMAYCMEGEASPPPPPLPPPPQLPAAFCHATCPQSLDESTVVAEDWRDVHFTYGREYTSYYSCDRNAPRPMAPYDNRDTAPWWRFESTGGEPLRMPNYETPTTTSWLRCGTYHPGWLNSQPSMGQSRLSTHVYFRNGGSPHWRNEPIYACACSYDGGATDRKSVV